MGIARVLRGYSAGMARVVRAGRGASPACDSHCLILDTLDAVRSAGSIRAEPMPFRFYANKYTFGP